MKILHAFSNWKWTGPAEPAVRLAESLLARHSVDFACGFCPYPDLENLVESAARAAGLELVTGLRLRKHFDPVTGVRDLAKLTRRVQSRGYDVVHTHLLNDHLLAGAAARRAGKSSIVVRSVYGGPDLSPRFRTALVFRRLTDGVFAASSAAAEVVRTRTNIAEERLFVIRGAVDANRFRPDALSALRDQARREFGFGPDDVVAGLVARIQRHRRFDLLLEAFSAAVLKEPRLRLLLIGRGTHQDELVGAPVRRLGLEEKVLLSGYREGEQFLALLAALDLGLFLVPGSDGSCRAARELAAASLPMIVTRRPPLPEIVEHGSNGWVVEEQVGELAGALASLAADPALRKAMGLASRSRAERLFSLEHQAEEVERAYERLLSLGIAGAR
ncbi:MAG: glycosyltransferase family 4 protein [Planctomycetota bacterium]